MKINQARNEPPDLVIIGHVAFNQDITPSGRKVSLGGSAYYCTVGAASVPNVKIAVVATVAKDFGIDALASLGIITDGIVTESEGVTARFTIVQRTDGTRYFAVPEWGVANNLHLERFPEYFWQAKHIHICTSPPMFQNFWLTKLRQRSLRPTLSIDLFEHFVARQPEQTLFVCEKADMIFMNQEESHLFAGKTINKPHIIKYGAGGAEYIDGTSSIHASALAVPAVDTTGAGEILAGVFLALQVRGTPKEIALAQAARTASRSVMAFGVEHIRSR